LVISVNTPIAICFPSQPEYVYVLMELASGGDLLEKRLKDLGKAWEVTEEVAVKMMVQSIINFLHGAAELLVVSWSNYSESCHVGRWVRGIRGSVSYDYLY
jgi:hypothetical protein